MTVNRINNPTDNGRTSIDRVPDEPTTRDENTATEEDEWYAEQERLLMGE